MSNTQPNALVELSYSESMPGDIFTGLKTNTTATVKIRAKTVSRYTAYYGDFFTVILLETPPAGWEIGQRVTVPANQVTMLHDQPANNEIRADGVLAFEKFMRLDKF